MNFLNRRTHVANLNKKTTSCKKSALTAEGKQVKRVSFGRIHKAQLSYAAERVNSELTDRIRKSVGCRNKIMVGKTGEMCPVFSCKRRWCPACSHIASVCLYFKYAPAINEIYELSKAGKMAGLYFVTLTFPNVPESQLKGSYVRVGRSWRKMMKLKAELKMAMDGVRKFESHPVRPVKDGEEWSYNHHMHVLVVGRDNARWLVKQWMRLHPDAKRYAQKIQKFTGNLREITKYTVKGLQRKNGWLNDEVHAEKLALLHEELFSKRTIFCFGKFGARVRALAAANMEKNLSYLNKQMEEAKLENDSERVDEVEALLKAIDLKPYVAGNKRTWGEEAKLVVSKANYEAEIVDEQTGEITKELVLTKEQVDINDPDQFDDAERRLLKSAEADELPP